MRLIITHDGKLVEKSPWDLYSLWCYMWASGVRVNRIIVTEVGS